MDQSVSQAFNEGRTASDTATRLGPAEQSVIALAQHDGLASIHGLSGWLDLVRRLPGASAVNALANPRLEALRRFVVVRRLRGDPSGDEGRRLLRAGFSRSEVAAVRRLVPPSPPKRSQPCGHPVAWALLLAAAIIVYLLVERVLHEPAISIVAAGLAVATLASFTAPRGHPR